MKIELPCLIGRLNARIDLLFFISWMDNCLEGRREVCLGRRSQGPVLFRATIYQAPFQHLITNKLLKLV